MLDDAAGYLMALCSISEPLRYPAAMFIRWESSVHSLSSPDAKMSLARCNHHAVSSCARCC
jgi:hypothetical protein